MDINTSRHDAQLAAGIAEDICSKIAYDFDLIRYTAQFLPEPHKTTITERVNSITKILQDFQAPFKKP